MAKSHVGVRFDPIGGRYVAVLYYGRRRYYLGRWPKASEAVVARDRAILFLGLPCTLQVPDKSRKLGPASPDELRQLARVATKRKWGRSPFIGVRAFAYGCWVASIWHDGGTITLGQYATAQEAALARDAAALYLQGERAVLNLPEKRVPPISPAELRRKATRATKAGRSSQFLGVYKTVGARGVRWAAAVGPGGRSISLGFWPTERDAALARDRAALHYLGARAKLNFPAFAGVLEPADAATVRAEAKEEARRMKAESAAERERGRGAARGRRGESGRADGRRRAPVAGAAVDGGGAKGEELKLTRKAAVARFQRSG